jgi:DNA-binding NarL/FixJ family response regulator
MMNPIRLLVADDHTLFRRGLISLLRSESQFEVVGEANDGEECLRIALDLKPDVVLMDLIMPTMDGVEATRRIMEANPQARVVVLTASEEDHDLFAAIQSGAQAYILKNADADELFRVVLQVHSGNAVLSPSVTLRVLQSMRADVQRTNPDKALTPRELEVMRLLTQGAANHQIAEKLSITENTVKTHVAHILEKLKLRSRAQVAAIRAQHETAR